MTNVVPSADQVTASSKCPLCGASEPHEHSGAERTIYENGRKAALALMKTPLAYWAPHARLVIAADKKAEDKERGLYQLESYYIPLYEKPVLR